MRSPELGEPRCESRLTEALQAEVVKLWQNCNLVFLRGHPEVEEILETGSGMEALWVEIDSVGDEVVFVFWKKRSCNVKISPEEWEEMTSEEKAYFVSDVCGFVSIPPDLELPEILECKVREKIDAIEKRNRGY